jgi:hypothetical protein
MIVGGSIMRTNDRLGHGGDPNPDHAKAIDSYNTDLSRVRGETVGRLKK